MCCVYLQEGLGRLPKVTKLSRADETLVWWLQDRPAIFVSFSRGPQSLSSALSFIFPSAQKGSIVV